MADVALRGSSPPFSGTGTFRSSRQATTFSPFATFQGSGLVRFKDAAKQVGFSVRKDGGPYVTQRVRQWRAVSSAGSSLSQPLLHPGGGGSSASSWRGRSPASSTTLRGEPGASGDVDVVSDGELSAHRSLELPAAQARVPARARAAGDLLPAADAGRGAWLRGQAAYLQAELDDREDQIRQMAQVASDSVLVRDQAQQQRVLHREQLGYHTRRADRLNNQIRALREEIATANNVSKILAGNEAGKTPPKYAKPEYSLEAEVESSLSGAPMASPTTSAADKAPTWLQRLEMEVRAERNRSSMVGPELDWESDSEDGEAQPPGQLAERHRAEIRRHLLLRAGSARKAFRSIDLNNSGNITLQEFADGLNRVGVDWQRITKLRRSAEIFKLFDQVRDWHGGSTKDGVITFRKLFPAEAREEERRREGDVDEFWRTWCTETDEETFSQRAPKWMPSTAFESLQAQAEAEQYLKQVQDKKTWMASSFRRMKDRDWTDAQCRELVAVHLRLGSGGKKRDECKRFTDTDVFAFKKAYMDSSLEPVKSVQKIVYDMREQKRTVNQLREQLKPLSAQASKDDDRDKQRFASLLMPSTSAKQREEAPPSVGDDDAAGASGD